jgi:hypothetical protein
MTMDTRLGGFMWTGIAQLTLLTLLVAFWMLVPVSHAECDKDASGEVYCGGGRCLRDTEGVVWCSRHEDGDAMRMRDGRVLCGRGQCEKDSAGEIYCSTQKGGSVLKDRNGRVRCFGSCERASADHCESTRAGSSP